MDFNEQKKLARQIFEKLGLKVDLSGCFNKIIPQLTIEQCIQVLNLVEDEKIKSKWAYHVGEFKPESRKDVIDFVTDSIYAYYWALKFGNRDIMIDRISDPEYAVWWAKDIGDRDIMINRVTDSRYAYMWALYIGNRDIMIDKITDSQYAYYWALYIGDRDVMINRVTDSIYAFYWALKIGNSDVMINRITDPEHAFYWATEIGDVDFMLPKFANTGFVFEYIKKSKSRKGIKEHLTRPDLIIAWIRRFGNKKYFSRKFPELSFA